MLTWYKCAFAAGSVLTLVGMVVSCTSTTSNGVGSGDNGATQHVCGAVPESTCPCANEGQRTDCGRVIVSYESQHLCGEGTMVCQGGKWGECIISNTVSIKSAVRLDALGGPVACPNPCTLNCQSFTDTPPGIDAGSGMTVVDGGLSLTPGAGTVTAPACAGGATQGTCAHSLCAAGTALANACDPCVTSVCAGSPSCCTTAWTGACIATMKTVCKRDCAADTLGACVMCYRDPADVVDHDGDGYTFAQGDCLDCTAATSAGVNPGAYDFPNGIDDNCDGTIDEPQTLCDTALPLASTTATDYAKAMELCKFTTSTATGAAKTWGVLTDGANAIKLAQADAVGVPNPAQYGILPDFGPSNKARRGSSLAVFSNGSARRPGDPGYVFPIGGISVGNTCAYPAGYPKTKAGCPLPAGGANDSSGLWMKIRVPTNAQSFSYNLHFFSSEYPSWVCTAYNDAMVARLFGLVPQNPANSNNISFDSLGNPISVNAGFFSVPGCPTCTSPFLTGTGFDGSGGACGGLTCGGSTNWLQTTAPVQPGETITMQFSIWDATDTIYDSTVLIDNWAWSPKTATISTLPVPPVVTTYSEASFVRDYDVTGLCPSGLPHWDFWSWNATTPSDSQIEFRVQTAANLASVAAAPVTQLKFTNPPGPAALAGQFAVAKTLPTNTAVGSTIVDSNLKGAGQPTFYPVLRVTSRLMPSTDKLSAPSLNSWNMSYSCTPAE